MHMVGALLTRGVYLCVNLIWLQAGVVLKEVEVATDAEQIEACYDVLRREHKGKPRPGLYYRQAQQRLAGMAY